jgi:hypothetical protein
MVPYDAAADIDKLVRLRVLDKCEAGDARAFRQVLNCFDRMQP